jgi:hypothetical protein
MRGFFRLPSAALPLVVLALPSFPESAIAAKAPGTYFAASFSTESTKGSSRVDHRPLSRMISVAAEDTEHPRWGTSWTEDFDLAYYGSNWTTEMSHALDDLGLSCHAMSAWVECDSFSLVCGPAVCAPSQS